MSDSAFERFYSSNARLPGPLGRGGAQGVRPGVLAPRLDNWGGSAEAGSVAALAGDWTGGMRDEYERAEGVDAGPTVGPTGLEALAPPGEWAYAGGADAWRERWMQRGASGGAGAVAGVSTARGFGALFESTSCLRYANGVCAMHGAPILPDSLAGEYDIASAQPGLLTHARVERCGCGMPKTKLLG